MCVKDFKKDKIEIMFECFKLCFDILQQFIVIYHTLIIYYLLLILLILKKNVDNFIKINFQNASGLKSYLHNNFKFKNEF